MKFVFAACLAGAASTLQAEMKIENLKATADFPGGSAVVKSVDQKLGIIHIAPQVRSERGWPCWW
jgi:hypothetical protein